MPVLDRVKKAWNAFNREEVSENAGYDLVGPSVSTSSPNRVRYRYYNDKSIVSAIYNRLAIDVAAVRLRHVQLDDQGRYLEDKDSSLNKCLTLEPNLDQGPRAFMQNGAMSLFDAGVIAIVPVDTVRNPMETDSFDILTMRVGDVVDWYSKHVKVSVYNEDEGRRQEITLSKRITAIVENPLYAVMNEQNSTLQRLIRKLQILDVIDEQSGSGKLDLIIQLPYVIRSESRQAQADKRKQDIEMQLKGSQYGIAYTDGTEKITQLNRPAENNLLKQVEFLTQMLYGQLGITEEIMNGTADEAAMLNYFNRTIEPIVSAFTEAMQRAFLVNSGWRQREKIMYFNDPFKLLPLKDIAEIADKLARNEVLTSNEIRGLIGFAPSTDPKADQLVNSNMPQSETKTTTEEKPSLEGDSQNGT